MGSTANEPVAINHWPFESRSIPESTYIKRPHSIVLAVVSAHNDFALQEVTEIASQIDPNGSRTLGLITKPDPDLPAGDRGLKIPFTRPEYGASM